MPFSYDYYFLPDVGRLFIGISGDLFGDGETWKIDEEDCCFIGVNRMLDADVFWFKPVKSMALNAAYMLSRDKRDGLAYDLGTV